MLLGTRGQARLAGQQGRAARAAGVAETRRHDRRHLRAGEQVRGHRITGPPTVGRNADSRLEVFALREGGALWHTWQTAPNNGWA